MAHEEDDDLYDEEFDFVDDEDISDEDDAEEASVDDSGDSDLADEPIEERAVDRGRDDRNRNRHRGADREPEGDRELERAPLNAEGAESEVPEDEYGRTAPEANYVVHVYEHQKFKRTIDRPFTPEDAEAFATEFNRTAKNYSRVALTGKNDAKPKKSLD